MEKKATPKISVLMAVFNAEKFIGRSVESVLGQTFRDFELICADDGSQDGTLGVLRELAGRDSRVKVVENKHKGACETLNTCLDLARGEYIVFIDNDDVYHRNALEEAFKAIDDTAFDIVVWDWEGVEDDGKMRPFCNQEASREARVIDDIVDWSVDNKHVSFWCKIYRRSVLSDMRFESNVIHGDWVFQWDLFLKKDLKAGYLPRILYRYYIRPESMDHCAMTLEKAVDRVLCVESVMRSCGNSRKLTGRVRRMFGEMIWSSYKNGRVYPEFKTEILRAISRCLRNGDIRLKDIPIVRRMKILLSVLFQAGK